VEAWVVPTDENRVIVRHTLALMGSYSGLRVSWDGYSRSGGSTLPRRAG
jgi:hypothetical protein